MGAASSGQAYRLTPHASCLEQTRAKAWETDRLMKAKEHNAARQPPPQALSTLQKQLSYTRLGAKALAPPPPTPPSYTSRRGEGRHHERQCRRRPPTSPQPHSPLKDGRKVAEKANGAQLLKKQK